MFANFFSDSKPVDEKELQVLELTDRIASSPSTSPELTQLYSYLLPFVPGYTALILQNVLNHMVQILSKPVEDAHLSPTIIAVLSKMVSTGDEADPKTDPLPQLSAHPNVPPALFQHLYPLDREVVRLVDTMFVKCPNIFTEFALKSWPSLIPLMKAIIETGNEDASSLLLRVVGSKKEILEALTPELKRHLRQFPAFLAINLMIASEELKTVIKEDEVEEWLSHSQRFTISDVEMIVSFYTFMWQRKMMIDMMLKVEPFEDVRSVRWMRSQKPMEIELDDQFLELAGNQLAHPPFSVTSVTRNYGTKRVVTNPGAGYAFLRLYIMSMGDPRKLKPEATEAAAALVFDANEWISAAAAQTQIIWMIKYDWKASLKVVYKSASAIFDRLKSREYSCLFKAFLRVLSEQYNLTVSILASEKELAYEPSLNKIIRRGQWCFPHMQGVLSELQVLPLSNFSESLKVLGYVVDYLGVDGQEEDAALE